jgi:DNA-binding transcriptional LysR family regulator
VDYNDIPVFIRVVETSSFTKAAKALGLQKSSVSRSITRLENDLGVRLLQRTTRQLGLTDAGQTFYDRVRGALQGFDDAAITVRELGSEPRGTIRVTSTPGAAALGLADAIASFSALYSSITIEVDLSARTVDLVSEGFDLALRAGRLADSSLIAKKVGTTDLALFASPAYLKAHGRPRTVAELAQHQCVLFRGRAGRASWDVRGPEGELTVEVHGPINCNEIEFAMHAAIAGGGIVALPPQLAREWYARGALQLVLDGHHLKGAEVHVVLPSLAFVPARVALFREHLVRELSVYSASVTRECKAAGHPITRAPAAPQPKAAHARSRQRQASARR